MLDEVVFAAGVNDSACVDEGAFNREVRLLTETLLQCVHDDRRLVYFSSAGQVYGEHAGLRNEITPCSPTTRYGIHKLACESLIRATDCSYLIVRLPNLVGQSKNRNQLIPQLILQAISGHATIKVRATRDLLGVDRLKSILLEILTTVSERETVVLASGISLSALEIFNEIQRILQCEANVKLIDSGDQQEFGTEFLRHLAPINSVFEPDYPYQLLQQYVPTIASSLVLRSLPTAF